MRHWVLMLWLLHEVRPSFKWSLGWLGGTTGRALDYHFMDTFDCGLVATALKNLGQISHALLPLSPSSINWYWRKQQAEHALHATQYVLTKCPRTYAVSGVWLRAAELEITAALCVLVAQKGLLAFCQMVRKSWICSVVLIQSMTVTDRMSVATTFAVIMQ